MPSHTVYTVARDKDVPCTYESTIHTNMQLLWLVDQSRDVCTLYVL